MRRLQRALGAATVLAFLAVAFTPLTHAVHRAFVVPERLAPASAIVVLGAGANGDYLGERSLRRAVHGLRLCHRGLAPVIVMHGPLHEFWPPESEIRAALARDLAVRAEVLALTGGRTTQEEAAESWHRLAPQGRTRILLVTGAHHMWRARALFEREGFEVLPAPVDEAAPAAARPELRLAMARSLLQEGLARVVYRLLGRV